MSDKYLKLDGVGSVDNRPFPASSTILPPKKYVTLYTWHVTRDMWHMTQDMWHIIFDTWWGWTFSQNVSYPALIIWDRQCLEDSEQKDDRIN